LFEEKSKDTEVWFKAKITKHGKKNVRDEMGNVLLKHVFTSLWISSKRPPGSTYVLIIADFVFIINSCLLPIHFVRSFFSSPGPKVHVNYCHHLASVVCRL
jgi:hypothetical protein